MKPAKIAFAAVAALAAAGSLEACSKNDVASRNLSTAADNFQIERQINFIDTITGQNIVTVKGLCALGNSDKAGELSVTCKVGQEANGEAVFIKDFFGLSNSVTYAVVQTNPAQVTSAQYSIVWNPGALVPNFIGTGGDPLTTTTAPFQTLPDTTQTVKKPPAGAILSIAP